jgi:hypothetical protein
MQGFSCFGSWGGFLTSLYGTYTDENPESPSTGDDTVIVDPQELLGCTFLMDTQEDGQRLRACIIECISNHEANVCHSDDHVKFRISVNEDEYKEIITYNELMDFIDKNQENDAIVWQFRCIVGHQGPLLWHDKDYNGSRFNVLVEWENGEITTEPLSVIAADNPVTAVCTIDIQPRIPSAHASSSRAKLAVGHMREGMRLPLTSVRKAYKRLRHIAKGNASATFLRMRKSSSLRRQRHAAISTAMAKNEDSIPKQMLDACGGREERQIIEEFMGDKVLGPVVLWFENYRISLSGLNIPKDGKVPMLNPDRVSKYGLETIYLVNCSSEGNFYATTDSAQ